METSIEDCQRTHTEKKALSPPPHQAPTQPHVFAINVHKKEKKTCACPVCAHKVRLLTLQFWHWGITSSSCLRRAAKDSEVTTARAALGNHTGQHGTRVQKTIRGGAHRLEGGAGSKHGAGNVQQQGDRAWNLRQIEASRVSHCHIECTAVLGNELWSWNLLGDHQLSNRGDLGLGSARSPSLWHHFHLSCSFLSQFSDFLRVSVRVLLLVRSPRLKRGLRDVHSLVCRKKLGWHEAALLHCFGVPKLVKHLGVASGTDSSLHHVAQIAQHCHEG